MKKICFITTTPTTLKAFIVGAACYLHEKGDYDITFISSNDDAFRKSLPDFIHYYPVNMSRGVNLDGIRVVKEMKAIFEREKFDIIQYSTPNAALYASIAGRMAHIENRLYCQWGIRYVGFYGIKRRIFKKIEKIICDNSTWIEPDSRSNMEFSFEEGLYNRQKSSVIWNGSASGVDLSRFNKKVYCSKREIIRKKYHLDNSVTIGFVGRLEKDKGINELFGAMQLLDNKYDVKLMIVGPEEKSQTIRSDLYEWARSNSNVVFVGPVENVEDYYAAMDIFTLPSYREGFGSVIVEAEAMGIPVVATNIPGPIDAMVNNKTGILVRKGDVQSLKKGLEKLISDKALREKYSSNAIKFASMNFDNRKLFRYILADRDGLIKNNEK